MLQVSFVPMKSVLFVGRYPTDKKIFALVHEDATKVRHVRVFQYGKPVGQSQWQLGLMACS